MANSVKPNELWIVTSITGETRWAYLTQEEAEKANDKIQPIGFHQRLSIERYTRSLLSNFASCFALYRRRKMTETTWTICGGTATLRFNAINRHIDCSTEIRPILEQALIKIGVVYEVDEDILLVDGAKEQNRIRIISDCVLTPIFVLFDTMGTVHPKCEELPPVYIDIEHVVADRQDIVSDGIKALLDYCKASGVALEDYRLELTLKKR